MTSPAGPPIAPSTTFASALIGLLVTDPDGKALGALRDLLVEPHDHTLVIDALVLGTRRATFQVPAEALVCHGRRWTVKGAADSYPRQPVSEDEIHLFRDVLDAQLIDTQGSKLVRVNDVQLNWVDDRLIVAGVDIGPWGLARRMGWARALAWLVSTFHLRVAEGLIPWGDVVPMTRGFHHLRLQVPSKDIQRLHPADLAAIAADLGHTEQRHLLAELSIAQVADVIEHSAPEVQAFLLRQLDDGRAAQVLEAMEPDEAADVLGMLAGPPAQDLIARMTPEHADRTRKLLAFKEGTAGAMMTPSFLALNAELSVAQGLRAARPSLAATEVISYFYLIDRDYRLVGVVPVRRLLLAEGDAALRDLATTALVFARVDTPCRDAAELVIRYKFKALPVLDNTDRLVGVVTIHDVLDYVCANQRR